MWLLGSLEFGIWESEARYLGFWCLGSLVLASGSCLGRLGQALGRLNCVLDVSWGRLGEFWRRLEASLNHLGRLLGRLEDVSGASGTSWTQF